MTRVVASLIFDPSKLSLNLWKTFNNESYCLFWEPTGVPLDKISKINVTHALTRLSASVSRRINADLSTYGGRLHMSVHPKPRNPYELPLHMLNSIDVCAIEKPPHTTGAFKFRANKGNIKGLKSIKVPKLTRQPQHGQNLSNYIINMPSKRHLAVQYYSQIIDRVTTIKDDTT
jgi:hypothetical protein